MRRRQSVCLWPCLKCPRVQVFEFQPFQLSQQLVPECCRCFTRQKRGRLIWALASLLERFCREFIGTVSLYRRTAFYVWNHPLNRVVGRIEIVLPRNPD